MAGYVIHIVVAEQYISKHTNKKENYNEFIEGVIAPDDVTDKSLTHYGPNSAQANLCNFLEKNELNNSYNRGYFLHLLTDYLFYNKYIDSFSKDIYNDYDILNPYLIEKYKVKIPKRIKDKIFVLKGCTKILNKELVDNLINEISDLDIDEIAIEIKNNPIKWTKFRTLKKI